MSSQHNSQPVFLSELIAGFSDLDVFFLLSALVSIIARVHRFQVKAVILLIALNVNVAK